MANEYKIEKYNVSSLKPRNMSRYPFKRMDVGDSFIVPVDEVASVGSLRASSSAAGRKLNFKFRVVVEKGEKTTTFRVIRVR